MKMRTVLVGLLGTLALSSTMGCKGGLEGAYALDKVEMKKSMEAEVAKLPAEQQGMAKFALAMIESMDMKLKLDAGGKLEMTSTVQSMEAGKPAKSETKNGEWRKDGSAVILKLEKEMNCTPDAKKLTCTTGQKGQPALVFVRT